MNYPTPYGKSDDLALENERLKALIKELKQRPDPWTEVYECEISHEEPYDFEYCTTHDRTFERGGQCDHKGVCEIDYLTDREMMQRGRAVRTEATIQRVRDLHKPVEVEPSDTICRECSNLLPNGLFLPVVEYPCSTIEALDGER